MTGNELKEMRKELGLKQDQMAVYMGMSTRRIAANEQRQEGSIPPKLEEEVLEFYKKQKQGGGE